MFLKISQILQKNTCVGVRCFPIKFAKISKTPVLKNICEGMPLEVNCTISSTIVSLKLKNLTNSKPSEAATGGVL